MYTWDDEDRPAVPPVTDYDDFSVAILRQWRMDAITARQQLMSTKRPVSLGESNGLGARNVTYSPPDIAKLDQYIRDLTSAISTKSTGRSGTRGRFFIT